MTVNKRRANAYHINNLEKALRSGRDGRRNHQPNRPEVLVHAVEHRPLVRAAQLMPLLLAAQTLVVPDGRPRTLLSVGRAQQEELAPCGRLLAGRF